MNENLNLVKILKDCPEGTELYSTICGKVKLKEVDNTEYTILLETITDYKFRVAQDGRYFSDFNGECTVCPSQEERDWSKFNPKKEELVSPCEFKDGDILSYQCGYFKNRTIYIYRYHKILNTAYYVALSGDTGSTFRINNKEEIALNGYSNPARFATEEEKQKLFDAIKENGYKWNAETKTLEKLVEPKFKVGDKIVNSHRKYMGGSGYQGTISEITDDKYIFIEGSYIYINNQGSWELAQDKKDKFDPKTLQPFDKVLGRNQKSQKWKCQLFSNIRKNTNYPYVCLGYYFKYCIPYNDDTKHLVGTKNEAPEFYRYWED